MRSKHLIIFILILVSGLFIEGLKKLAGYSTDNIKPAPLASGKEYDVRPFQLTQNDIERDNARNEARSRFLKNNPKSTTIENHPTGGMKLQNATVKVAESTLKAPVDPKKKKKKKKNGRGQADKDKKTETAKTDNKDKDTSMAQKFLNQSQPVTAVATVALANTDPNKIPISYEDWAKMILGSPQPQNVTKLVEYFTSRMVSGEVFYAILNAMMNESNPEQHSLAVGAASQVQNAQSFQFVVEVIRAEKFSAKVTGEATNAIRDYSKLNAVSQLRGIMSGQSEDAVITQLAVETLDQSTRVYLEGRSPSAEAKPLTPEQISRYKKVFSPFATILPKIIQAHGSNRAIIDPAQRALNRIKNLVGSVVQSDSRR